MEQRGEEREREREILNKRRACMQSLQNMVYKISLYRSK
jgi:hypothetical protein